ERRHFARIGHVARGIFEADEARAEGLDQSLDQSDVPGQAGLGGEVIEINGDWLCGRSGHDGLDIGDEPVVRRAFIVERRQDKRSAEAKRGGVPRQRDRVGDRRRAGADHEAIERQTRVAVGGHHALALLERERGGLAGGAEHVQSVAAIGEQKTRQRHRAGAIGLPCFVHGGCDGGDHALKLAGGHVASCLRAGEEQIANGRLARRYSAFLSATGYRLPRHPLTLNAASAAILTSWASLAESGTICTDRSSPTRIGPMTVAPPSSCNSLVEIEAEWNAGMISTLAGPDRRQNG